VTAEHEAGARRVAMWQCGDGFPLLEEIPNSGEWVYFSLRIFVAPVEGPATIATLPHRHKTKNPQEGGHPLLRVEGTPRHVDGTPRLSDESTDSGHECAPFMFTSSTVEPGPRSRPVHDPRPPINPPPGADPAGSWTPRGRTWPGGFSDCRGGRGCQVTSRSTMPVDRTCPLCGEPVREIHPGLWRCGWCAWAGSVDQTGGPTS
jgi:hypothetical protein